MLCEETDSIVMLRNWLPVVPEPIVQPPAPLFEPPSFVPSVVILNVNDSPSQVYVFVPGAFVIPSGVEVVLNLS